MKNCDAYTIANVTPSRTLMERAARAAADRAIDGTFDTSRTLVLCGAGNNGGDGLAAAVMLRSEGIPVSFAFVGDEAHATDECAYRLAEARRAGVPEVSPDPSGYTLVLDAILGIGLKGDVREDVAGIINAVNESGVAVLSLDIPSGINADTGAVCGTAVRADATVTFAYLKPGLLLYPGREYSGNVTVADIGIGTEGAGDGVKINFVEASDAAARIPERHADSHKGSYGKLLCAAGSIGMAGAAYLCALGAYRSGVGLAQIYTPEKCMIPLQTRLPEAIVTPYKDSNSLYALAKSVDGASAVAAGPGIGTGNASAAIIYSLLEAEKPLLIDADGLNIISASKVLREKLKSREYPTIITPHPAEMSRLAETTVPEICADVIGAATAFAAEYGVTVVLKGSVTVITDGDEVYLASPGSSALAKGGSGDVLSGIIGAFLAAGKDALDACIAGVYVHGTAGRIAAGDSSEYSLLASDVANAVGRAIKAIKG